MVRFRVPRSRGLSIRKFDYRLSSFSGDYVPLWIAVEDQLGKKSTDQKPCTPGARGDSSC